TGALLALAAREKYPSLALVALVPVAAFWLMDANYLELETSYRALFDQARRSEVEPFAMKARPTTWSGRLRALRSWSILMVHGALGAAGVAVTVVLEVT